MVLSKEQTTERLTNLKQNIRNYMVLDISSLPYKKNINKFSYAVEVLNLINTAQWMNKLSENLKSETFINTDILHQVIDAIFLEKSFRDEQLETYFKTMNDIIAFDNFIENFTERESYIPFYVEYMLFGLSFEKQEDFSDDLITDLDSDYDKMLVKLQRGNENINIVINKTKQIISKFINENLEKGIALN